MDKIKYLCPTCEHASHDWCNLRPEITEAQTECKKYKPSKPNSTSTIQRPTC